MGPIAKQWIQEQTKLEILAVIKSSQQQGVSVRRSCSILSIEHRRIIRWQHRARHGLGLTDLSPGPKEPLHRILPEEIDQIVAMAKSQEYVDLSHRIMAVTAWDKGLFQASFSTVYRVLKERNLMTARGPGGAHNGNSNAPVRKDLTGPNQRWCWDISYLMTFQKGVYLYLYLLLDEYSRKTIQWRISWQQTAEESRLLLEGGYRRVMPTLDEMESMIRVGAFDGFGKTRTAQFWESRHLHHAFGDVSTPGQGWLPPPPATDRLPAVPLQEPTRRQRLEWETELLDFTASGHPLELYDHIAWDTYCPVNKLAHHVGQQIVTCGLIIEQRTHHQITGEPMKFLTLADWTGIVETELFAPTYRNYGLATIRYPVLEVTATVEPFENGRGFSLRVLRAGKPRQKFDAQSGNVGLSVITGSS